MHVNVYSTSTLNYGSITVFYSLSTDTSIYFLMCATWNAACWTGQWEERAEGKLAARKYSFCMHSRNYHDSCGFFPSVFSAVVLAMAICL